MTMGRVGRGAVCVVLGMSAACNKQEPAAKAPAASQKPADPAFDKAWATATGSLGGPSYIEGDAHGAGLVGEVRRAVDPVPAGNILEAPTGALEGPLPDGEVVRVIRTHLSAVKACYAEEERLGTVGSGKAIVTLDIAPTGTVSAVQIDAPAFAASKLPSCVEARARNWTFPKFTTGPKRFAYPLVFVGG